MEEITRILSAASHFEVLQVTHSSATDAEVKKQYRVLALQTHPDKNKDERAEEAFKRVTEAFQSLETREKRDRYHASGGRGFKHHSEEDDDDDMDFGHDAHAFFNMFMQMHMGGGRFGGGMEQFMFMMMMEQMMNRDGMFFDEDEEYYEYFDDDDEYFDDDDEYFDDEEEEEYDDRPGRFNHNLQKHVCEKCQVHTTTREEMIGHLQGKRHARAMEQEDFFCETCQLRTTTKTAKQNHLSGKKHLRNIRSSSAKKV